MGVGNGDGLDIGQGLLRGSQPFRSAVTSRSKLVVEIRVVIFAKHMRPPGLIQNDTVAVTDERVDKAKTFHGIR